MSSWAAKSKKTGLKSTAKADVGLQKPQRYALWDKWQQRADQQAQRIQQDEISNGKKRIKEEPVEEEDQDEEPHIKQEDSGSEDNEGDLGGDTSFLQADQSGILRLEDIAKGLDSELVPSKRSLQKEKKERNKRRKVNHDDEEVTFTLQDKLKENHLVEELFGSDFVTATPKKVVLGEDKINKGKKANAPVTIKEEPKSPGGAAWVDEDDENISVALKSQRRTKKLRENFEEDKINGADYVARLRARHDKMAGQNLDWAKFDDKEGEGEDQDLLATTRALVNEDGKIASTMLSINRLPNATGNFPHKSSVCAVQFHANSQLLMSAGNDNTVKIIKINPKGHELVHSSKVADMKLAHAQMTPDGRNIIVTGNKNSFHVINVDSGKASFVRAVAAHKGTKWEKICCSPDNQFFVLQAMAGATVVLMSVGSLQWVADLQAALPKVTCVAFAPDSSKAFIGYVGGSIIVWDLKTRQAVHRFSDAGLQSPQSIAVSSDMNWLATGSPSGIVNIYKLSDVLPSTPGQRLTSNPTVHKEITALVTSVDTLSFNHDSQMLLMASSTNDLAVRVVHVPSFRVFPNWPKPTHTKIKRVTAGAFSPQGGYLALGNKEGVVTFWRLGQYLQA